MSITLQISSTTSMDRFELVSEDWDQNDNVDLIFEEMSKDDVRQIVSLSSPRLPRFYNKLEIKI